MRKVKLAEVDVSERWHKFFCPVRGRARMGSLVLQTLAMIRFVKNTTEEVYIYIIGVTVRDGMGLLLITFSQRERHTQWSMPLAA